MGSSAKHQGDRQSASSFPTSKQAVIYCRVSTQEQVEGFSLSMQEGACRDFCKKKGYGVLAVFVDEGESARTTHRPKFIKMLAYCQKHAAAIDKVVVYRYDRFARSSLDHHTVRTLLGKYGIGLVSATQEIEDTPEGKLFETIVAGFNQYESDVIGIRAKDGMTEARRQGRWTNPAPMGYRFSTDESGKPVLVVDEKYASVISEVFKLFATGTLTKTQVAQKITGMGYRSPSGRSRMTSQDVDRILHKPIYAGRVFINEDEGWVQSSFPALVEDATFEAVARMLARQSTRKLPHSRVRSDFPLRGLVRCAECGHPLTSSFSTGRKGTRYPYYRCFRKGCGKVEVRGEVLEGAFLDLLGGIVPSRQAARRIKGTILSAYRERQAASRDEALVLGVEIGELEKKVFSLHESFVVEKRLTDSDLYQKMLTRYKAELAQKRIAREELEQECMDISKLLDYAFGVLLDARTLWLEADPDQRQRLQRAIFPQGVEYSPASGFGTPATSCQFDVLGLLREPEVAVAGEQGFEPR